MKMTILVSIIILLIMLTVYLLKLRERKNEPKKFIPTEIEREYKEEVELHKIYIEKQTQKELYETFGNHDRQKARSIATRQRDLESALLNKYKHHLPNIVINKKSIVYDRYKEALKKYDENKKHIRKMDKQKKPSSNSPAYQQYLTEYLMWRDNIVTLEKEVLQYQLEHLILYQEFKAIDLQEKAKVESG